MTAFLMVDAAVRGSPAWPVSGSQAKEPSRVTASGVVL
jgi:hypothetical protein